jgi:hypothetical protein
MGLMLVVAGPLTIAMSMAAVILTMEARRRGAYLDVA